MHCSRPTPVCRHSRRRAILALLAAFAAMFVVARAGAALRTSQRANRMTLDLGADLSDLELPLSSGGVYRIRRDMQRPVLLVYASERCPHCHAELARLAKLMLDEPSIANDLALVVVTPGRPPSNGQPADSGFIPAGLSHLRVFDPLGDIAITLRVRAVPLSLVVGRDGRVRSAHLGQSDRPDLRQRLLAVTSGPVAITETP